MTPTTAVYVVGTFAFFVLFVILLNRKVRRDFRKLHDNNYNQPLDNGYDTPLRPRKETSILLTARMLESINIQRKLKGRQPMTRRGFQIAIGAAPPREFHQRVPDEWIAYLTLHDPLPIHESPTTALVNGDGITINTSAPYNGQGAVYGGGVAAAKPGSWDAGGFRDADPPSFITGGGDPYDELAAGLKKPDDQK